MIEDRPPQVEGRAEVIHGFRVIQGIDIEILGAKPALLQERPEDEYGVIAPGKSFAELQKRPSSALGFSNLGFDDLPPGMGSLDPGTVLQGKFDSLGKSQPFFPRGLSLRSGGRDFRLARACRHFGSASTGRELKRKNGQQDTCG